jgi:hypothetical protein
MGRIAKKRVWNKTGQIRNALRKIWMWSPLRTAALGKARIGRGSYLCAMCGKIFGPKEVEVDHILRTRPEGSDPNDWNGFIERLFCDLEGLQVLC